jgi:deoxycytidine triphosphate deaminase
MTPDFNVEPQYDMLPPEIAPAVGLLRDVEIEEALSAGYLLIPRTAKRENIRYASYQLSIGKNIFFLSRDKDEQGDETTNWKEFGYGDGQWFQIVPGATAKVFAEEEVNIPKNVIAHSIPVGNLYELGLTPEVTYADPGFSGPFWIIVCNYSSRIVELKVGDRLARLEFTKLHDRPKRVHDGAHAIRQLERYPLRMRKKTPAELAKLDLEVLLQEISTLVDPPHYEHAFVTERVKSDVAQKMAELTKALAINKILVYVSLGISAIFVWTIIRPHLPPILTGKLGDWLLTTVIAGITAVLLAFQKDVREVLRQIARRKGDTS